MKRLLALAAGLCLALSATAQMPKLDDLLKGAAGLKSPAIGATDDKTGAAGIKEALAVGTENAVKSLGRPDGYFANEAVKILMPEKIRKVSEVARMAGFQRQVDEFVLRMNRAGISGYATTLGSSPANNFELANIQLTGVTEEGFKQATESQGPLVEGMLGRLFA